jgi:hypothetical protein
VSGSWSSNIPVYSPPNNPNQSWNFCPADTGKGTITATYAGLNAQVAVTVIAGAPDHIVLYGQPGTPVGKTPLNDPALYYNVNAGASFPMYARIFDRRGVWLSQYDNASAPVTWKVVELTNPGATGTLSPLSGNTSTYSPTVAYQSLYAIATFTPLGKTDTVQIRTLPGNAAMFTIQLDTASISGWSSPTSITMTAVDTTDYLYAVLRDAWGNFINYERTAVWSSDNAAIVSAASGTQTALGQGVVRRETDAQSQTVVRAQSGDGMLKDSITVIVSPITYTALRITTTVSIRDTIDTLRIRTDQDTVLYAMGRRSDNGLWDNVVVQWSNGKSDIRFQSVPRPDVDRVAANDRDRYYCGRLLRVGHRPNRDYRGPRPAQFPCPVPRPDCAAGRHTVPAALRDRHYRGGRQPARCCQHIRSLQRVA